MATEIEAKFAVPDAAVFERLQAATELAGYTLAEAAGKEVRDTYLDTPGREIAAAGYFCRRRRRGGGILITCKQLATAAGEGAVHRRDELEVTLPREAPPQDWPEGPVRDLVLAAAGDRPLEPLVELRQTRLVRWAVKGDKTVAEVSLDRVTVGGADGDRPPYFEVEAELVVGGEADLAAIAACLRDEYGLTPEPRSKFERALEAVGAAAPAAAPPRPRRARARPRAAGAPARRRAATRTAAAKDTAPAPPARTQRAPAKPATALVPDAATVPDASPVREATAIRETLRAPDTARATTEAPAPATKRPRRPGLRADDTMAEAARKTLRFHFARMLEHEAGTRLGEDPEELHVMRVSTRRMRAALRVFEGHLDPQTVRPFVRGLRRTGRALGDVRDLDVFNEKTQDYLETLPPERRDDLEPLLSVWRAQREAARGAHARLPRRSPLSATSSPTSASFSTHPTPAPCPPLFDDGEALPARVADVLPAALYERMAAVWAYDAPLAAPDPPLVRFHRLRIAGKSLRYTLEFFEEVLGAEARPLIKSTKRLQDHLGDLQDAVVASNVLRNVLLWGTWDLPAKPGKTALQDLMVPGLAAYLASRQEELRRLVATFPETWPQIRGPEFSRRLAAIVGELTARQPRRRRSAST